MKKYRKIWAVLLTLAMVLGMSMTTMAAAPASKIEVKGLSAQEEETVNLYAAITLNEAENAWVVADWAQPYVTLDTANNKYIVTDWAGLSAAAAGTPIQQQHAVGVTNVTFNNVPVGAYVITASGNKINYAPMVAETYDNTAETLQAKNAEVTAKSTGYELTKKQKIEATGNKFVKRGETLTFEITTTFPAFEKADSKDNVFTIVDTPTGLDITDITSLTVGNAALTKDTDYTMTKDSATGAVTIDLTKYIGKENAHAGQTVVVTYTAIVTAAEGTADGGIYKNTANAYRNGTETGGDNEEGWTGDITLTKTDDAENEKDRKQLNGAEFEVYKNFEEKDGKVTANEADKLYFVKEADGVYKLALSKDETNATSTVVATNGTVQVKGLDEGTYWFKETKAPSGYSINAAGKQVTITLPTATDNGKLQNVSVSDTLTDTKLSALPSTGGIGTTIFTIGGCAIMIAAAFLFFASRKKNDNK